MRLRFLFNFLMFMIFATTCVYAQTSKIKFDSQQDQIEIDSIIEKTGSLNRKLPTYKKYYPNLFMISLNGQLNMQMLLEEESPDNIEAYRYHLAEVFKKTNSVKDCKILLCAFIDEIEIPSEHTRKRVLAIYVEHINESHAFIYYYPYIKSVFGKIVFDESLNFIKSIDKIILE